MRHLSILIAAVLTLAGCDRAPSASSGGADVALDAHPDSAFVELQQRGASSQAMGVDQYTSQHRFDDLADGGRIELQRDADDAADIQQIRSHLRHIAGAFAQGDFRIPGFVHDMADVPGTQVMRERRSLIAYEFRELPRGGEVRIRSNDRDAIEGIHAFLAFQRSDHRAGGHAAH